MESLRHAVHWTVEGTHEPRYGPTITFRQVGPGVAWFADVTWDKDRFGDLLLRDLRFGSSVQGRYVTRSTFGYTLPRHCDADALGLIVTVSWDRHRSTFPWERKQYQVVDCGAAMRDATAPPPTP